MSVPMIDNNITLFYYLCLMKNQSMFFTPSSFGGDYQTMESSKLSRVSMTSEQRKLNEFGMFFPEKVIYTAKLDIKTPKEEWEENVPIKLTSQAFGHIPISSITKIKYYRMKESGKFTLKVIATSSNAFFQVDIKNATKIFSLIAWSKLATMNIFADLEDHYNDLLKDKIYKKSQILKNWEKRFVSITNKNGLQSSKDAEGLPSLKISSTSQIWTRFETINEENYLVIKLWHGIIKHQFAVPVENAVKWIQGFCTLLSQKQ